MKKKRHSREEVAMKLSQADELQERGKTQADIVRTLGVSAMTYHRWRKARTRPAPNGTSDQWTLEPDEIREENARLRQLVTDLSLEKHKLQETVRALKKQ